VRRNFKKIFLLQVVLLLGFYHSAVCQIIHVPFDSCIKNAEFIFEGMVVSSKSYETPDSNVYTASIVKISKIFKGRLKCGNVEIITMGGRVGNEIVDIEDGFMLSGTGYGGVFMCSESLFPALNAPRENPKALDVYAGSQSFVLYKIHKKDTIPGEVFKTTSALYKYIESKTGRDYSSCEISNEIMTLPPVESIHNEIVEQNKLPQKNNDFESGGSLPVVQNIEVFPNPITNIAIIKIPNDLPVNLVIYDDSGKTVFQKENADEKMLQKLDLSSLKPGNYIGRAASTNGKNIFNFKFGKLQ
jgi:hypothetical protein